MIKMNAKELRLSKPLPSDLKKIKRNPITIVVDNVLDAYNIGGIFRLADAVAAEKVYLCGSSQTPPYHRIQKASVGTWAWVPWEYSLTATQAIANLKQKVSNCQIIALEQHPKSILYNKINYTFPLAFIIGHETSGVSAEALKMADYIAEIPMYGVNKSLNVMVSLAIVMFYALNQTLGF